MSDRAHTYTKSENSFAVTWCVSISLLMIDLEHYSATLHVHDSTRGKPDDPYTLPRCPPFNSHSALRIAWFPARSLAGTVTFSTHRSVHTLLLVFVKCEAPSQDYPAVGVLATETAATESLYRRANVQLMPRPCVEQTGSDRTSTREAVSHAAMVSSGPHKRCLQY